MNDDTSSLEKQIEGCLATEFEQRLFKASLNFLDQNKNPLKFNAFAFSLRELHRHVMKRLAPDDLVKDCSWFVQDTNIQDGRLTRFQRFKYAVQKGLSDKFVADVLKLDPKETWSEVKDSIESLSKLTHVGPNTFDLEVAVGREHANSVVEALCTIFASIEDLRSELERSLYGYIDQAVVDAAVRETNTQIDLLSSNSIIEGTEISSWEISSIDAKEIRFSGEGTAHVSLEWGRGEDHAQMSDEYPFSFTGLSSVSEPRKPKIESNQIHVDTSEWYE